MERNLKSFQNIFARENSPLERYKKTREASESRSQGRGDQDYSTGRTHLRRDIGQGGYEMTDSLDRGQTINITRYRV